MKLDPMGDAAWRIELPTQADPASVLEVVRRLSGVIDAVVTDRHVVVRFSPARPPEDPRQAIAAASTAPARERPLHLVRVRYDGPDLREVARASGLSVDAVVRLHSAREYAVELIGFLPGFAYLGKLDPALDLPRRASPRPRIPAGSVAIAAGRTGVYPLASPGGWHLLGTALDFVPFDPARGCLLSLGDRVRFEPVEVSP